MRAVLVLLLFIGLALAGISIIVRDFSAKKETKENKAKGNDGELILKQELGKVFPNARILHDLIIDLGDGRYSQIDLVVVDITGVYVIECKNYNCLEVRGQGGSSKWEVRYNSKTYEMYSPVFQNYTHKRVISEILGMNIDDINASVVFVKNTKLTLSGVRPNEVLLMKDIIRLKGSYTVLSPLMVTNIYDALSHFTNPTKKTQKKQVKYAKSFA